MKVTETGVSALSKVASQHIENLLSRDIQDQTLIPKIAKDPAIMAKIRAAVADLETRHVLHLGDARDLSFLPDESIHLVVTSPPYWTLKEYLENGDQLGHIEDYDHFVSEIEKVWKEVYRVLVPGGRIVIVVGDVNVSRREFGRHLVFPLHASIQESCRRVGFDNLAPIIWYKIANANFEAGGGGFLGKPYEPNGIIKNDIEYILMQRKPGGYRKPTPVMRLLSTISAEEHQEWFQQIWQLPGASTKHHPAPFPVELAERLIWMFSFVGDTVLDPFVGSGSTTIAASNAGRNSIGVEIEDEYLVYAHERIKGHFQDMFVKASFDVVRR
jgi:DNA modification methylase